MTTKKQTQTADAGQNREQCTHNTPAYRNGQWQCLDCGHAYDKAQGKPELPEHSPLPWEHNATQPFTRYDGEREHGFAAAVWGPNDEPICSLNFSVGKWKALSPEVQDANAKLIVASVNNAEKLAEALRVYRDCAPLEFSHIAKQALATWEASKQ